MASDGQLVRCSCQREADRERAWRAALGASNLTPRLLRQTFDTFDARRAPGAREALAAFAAMPAGWILLIGTVGTGKTHLMAATANALLAAGRRPLYVVAPDFLAYVRRGMRPGDDAAKLDAEARVAQAIEADVLLLDDLGAEHETGWTEEQFYRVINGRYNAEAPTVVATNLLPTDLAERVASRLCDRGLVRQFVLAGEDYRQSDAQAQMQMQAERAGGTR